MKIDLEVVRQVLKEALGFDSFVASFINQVVDDNDQPTAAISAKGILYYNPEFVNKYVTCNEDLFSLIFHELLHPMFCHFIYKNGMIENISADAIINAVITNIYSEHSMCGNLFKKFYDVKGMQGLLRPNSELSKSKYYKVYNKLYGKNHANDMTTGELIQTLKILTQTEKLSAIVLIGSHGDNSGKSDSQTDDGFTNEILSEIADDVKRSLKGKGGRYAGFSLNLMELFMESLKTHLSIKKVLLQKFLTKRKIDKFREYHNVRNSAVSPIPLHPSKRDLVLLASGFCPGYFHNKLYRPKCTKKGLAIYLDVSGSVNDYLPKIIGILSNLKNDITTIFLFSNIVVEIRFEKLLAGKLTTTYGTDFDCIATSILERRFDKAIVITDGYASMSEENAKQLMALKTVTLTILFGEADECDDFAQFGDLVMLEDICQ